MVLPVSPKVGLGNNCFVLDVYDVVPRVGRINRGKLTRQLNAAKLVSQYSKASHCKPTVNEPSRLKNPIQPGPDLLHLYTFFIYLIRFLSTAA